MAESHNQDNKIAHETKSPTESAVEMTELILPTHTNAIGTVFGGAVMAWIDVAAAISAGKHARKTVVTASVDALHFIAPAKLGHVLHIYSMVNYTSRTSMEVGVRVDSEDLKTGKICHNVTAYTTFVALDEKGKPTPVAKILVQTKKEKRRFEAAQVRKESRIKLAQALKEKWL